MNVKVNAKSTRETVNTIKKKSSELKKEVDEKFVLRDSREIINVIDRKTHIIDD